MNPLAAIDWGTSTLRGALLDATGQVTQEREFPRGLLTVPAGGFPAVFQQCFGDWMQDPKTLCLIAGMAGSRQGWLEAPYCDCPAGAGDLAARLAWVEPGRIAIVPGVACLVPGLPGVAGMQSIPDVMRGEETQVFGALDLHGLHDATVLLPGTHSKWVRVVQGRIVEFRTAMTGELYGLLRSQSILSRGLPPSDGPLDGAAFDQGVALALRGPGLLHSTFSARTLGLFGRMKAQALPSYLSGLVIGEELRERWDSGPAPEQDLIAVGNDALTARYERALALRDIRVTRVGAEAAWRGLRLLAAKLPQ